MNFTRRSVLGAALATPLIPICAAAQETTFEPVTDLAPDEAAIYVFRPRRLVGGAGAFHFNVGESETRHVLRNGRHLVIRVPAGTHILRQIPGRQLSLSTQMVDLRLPPLEVNAEAGRHYYVAFIAELDDVKAFPLVNGSIVTDVDSSFYFVQVAEEDALVRIARTRADAAD